MLRQDKGSRDIYGLKVDVEGNLKHFFSIPSKGNCIAVICRRWGVKGFLKWLFCDHPNYESNRIKKQPANLGPMGQNVCLEKMAAGLK